jgi:hypothetical protein
MAAPAPSNSSSLANPRARWQEVVGIKPTSADVSVARADGEGVGLARARRVGVLTHAMSDWATEWVSTPTLSGERCRRSDFLLPIRIVFGYNSDSDLAD